MTINDLPEGGTAHILSISAAAPELAARLREIGFCEGDEVQLLARWEHSRWRYASAGV